MDLGEGADLDFFKLGCRNGVSHSAVSSKGLKRFGRRGTAGVVVPEERYSIGHVWAEISLLVSRGWVYRLSALVA